MSPATTPLRPKVAGTAPGSFELELGGAPQPAPDAARRGQRDFADAAARAVIVALFTLMLGVISDLIRTNRILIEDNLEHTKRTRFGVPGRAEDPPHARSVLSSDRTAVH